jgi:MFS transporter, DHA2 family, triacylglyceride efflux pump
MTPRWTLGVASLAVLLAAADTYVVVLALPDMMVGIGLGVDELQRATPIISAFLLGYVATLPLIGRLADLRGCRPVLIGCLLLFALGCLVTAASTDLSTLIVGRFLQGVGGGGLVPATLALVGEAWPAERRGLPLGVVGAVQETGSTLGPLVGAAILAASGWRAIFYANLIAAAALTAALGFRPAPAPVPAPIPIPVPIPVPVPIPASATLCSGMGPQEADSRTQRRTRGVRWAAGVVGAVSVVLLGVFLVAPERLLIGVNSGRGWEPTVGEHAWSAPLALAAIVTGIAALALWLSGVGLRELLTRVDALGSLLLAGALAGLVLAFATTDPQVAVVSGDAPYLLVGSALLAVGFVVRQRMTREPLIPPGTLRRRAAWGSLAVNLLIGAALMAALVDVPVFARATTQDEQLGAALVLVRLLIAVPLGALLGGWLIRHVSPGVVAAGGMVLAALALAGMTTWGDATLRGAGGTLELVAAGLGFGLAIAPVNAALLAATAAPAHGVASALVVVARMIGMLAGLSVLTAVGLRVFYRAQARIGTVVELCPATPTNCPAYTDATHDALLSELHAIFGGAALCAGLAAVACLVLLRGRPAPAVTHQLAHQR